MFNPVHKKKTFGKNAPDKQRRNKTMASEVAAIFCSGAKALSCCVNGSHQKMFHSETRFRRYVSGREAPCLAGGCATAFLPILFKEGRNIKSPWYYFFCEVRLRGASTSTTMKWKRQGPSRQESQVAQHEASPNVMDKPLPRHIFWVNVTIFTDET